VAPSPNLLRLKQPTPVIAGSTKVGHMNSVKPSRQKQAINPVKPPHILKAQGSGMSPDDLRVCRVTLKKLRAHKHAEFFQQPVDPVRDHAPGYV
jgi:transcription initiation factor TFIID subunit 2